MSLNTEKEIRIRTSSLWLSKRHGLQKAPYSCTVSSSKFPFPTSHCDLLISPLIQWLILWWGWQPAWRLCMIRAGHKYGQPSADLRVSETAIRHQGWSYMLHLRRWSSSRILTQAAEQEDDHSWQVSGPGFARTQSRCCYVTDHRTWGERGIEREKERERELWKKWTTNLFFGNNNSITIYVSVDWGD